MVAVVIVEFGGRWMKFETVPVEKSKKTALKKRRRSVGVGEIVVCSCGGGGSSGQ